MVNRKFETVYSHSKSTVGIVFTDKSMTQQHFLKDCDINHIMKKYESTGFLGDPLNPGTRQPLFGDFTNAPDFREAQDSIIRMHEDFNSLPSSIRKRFNNNPAELLDFIANSDNYEEAVQLGLIDKVVSLDPVNIDKPIETTEVT